MSYKPKILEVAASGTGAATLTGVVTGNGASAATAATITQNGVLYGGASNAVSSTSAAASGTVLKGTSASAPTFNAAIAVTSINFGGTAFARYVEGTFVPTLTGSVSNPTVTYTTQIGRYTRIGNRLIVNISILISAFSGGSGNIRVSTLPFTPNATGTGHGWAYFDNVTFTGSWLDVRIASADTNLIFQKTASAGVSGILQIAGFTTNSSVNLTAIYEI